MADLPEGGRGRALALALLALVAAALWLGVAAPLLDFYAAGQERMAAQGRIARRMAQIATELPDLKRLSSETAASQPVPVLAGATDALAGAGLQQQVQEIASGAGATVASMESMSAEAVGGYRRIGLRIAVNSPLPVLVQMLAAIGDAQPRMLVNDLQIHASRGLVPDPAAPLNASFVVAAFRAGAGS